MKNNNVLEELEDFTFGPEFEEPVESSLTPEQRIRRNITLNIQYLDKIATELYMENKIYDRDYVAYLILDISRELENDIEKLLGKENNNG